MNVCPMDEPQFSDDVICPKSGERIPLDKYSISKFTDTIYFVHCPKCRALHQFTTKQ